MAHDQEVVGSNTGTVYWMYLSHDASYYIKRKLKIKVAKWGTPKKKKLTLGILKYINHSFALFSVEYLALHTPCQLLAYPQGCYTYYGLRNVEMFFRDILIYVSKNDYKYQLKQLKLFSFEFNTYTFQNMKLKIGLLCIFQLFQNHQFLSDQPDPLLLKHSIENFIKHIFR